MTQEFLEDALSEVRDEFIAEAAEEDPIEAPKILPLKKRSQKAWVSIAAVLCVAALALPLRFFFGGMGSSADSADDMMEAEAEEPSGGEEQEAGDLPDGGNEAGELPDGRAEASTDIAAFAFTVHNKAKTEWEEKTTNGAVADAETSATKQGDGFLYYMAYPDLKTEGQPAPVALYHCLHEDAPEDEYFYLTFSEADILGDFLNAEGAPIEAKIADAFQSLADLTSRLHPLYLVEFEGHYYACIGQDAYPLEDMDDAPPTLKPLVDKGEEVRVASFYASDYCP